MTRHVNASIHNKNIYATVPFEPSDKVRILEKKGKFDKGKQKVARIHIAYAV
jgi:hypothetical protein